jgi:uncharacterized protein involved in exopolysaccharide biosynthesis
MDDDLFISRREILAVLFRRRKGILAILVSALATAAFAVYYLISPSYEAEAVIMINSSYLTEPLRDGPPESDFEKLALFHTQRDVLKSERMAAEAVRRTNLAETRVIGRIERLQMFMGEIKRQAGLLLGIERWQKPWSPEGAAIAAVYDSVRTFALPDSKALKVTLRAKDPKEAAEVLSALLDAHRDYYFTVVRGKASGAVAFLEQEFLRSQGVLSEASRLSFSSRIVTVCRWIPPRSRTAQPERGQASRASPTAPRSRTRSSSMFSSSRRKCASPASIPTTSAGGGWWATSRHASSATWIP